MSENTNTQPEQPAAAETARTDAPAEVNAQVAPQSAAAPTPSGDVPPAAASAPQQTATQAPVPPQPAPASQQPYSEAHQQQPFYPQQPVVPPAPLAALSGGMKFGWFVIGALVGIPGIILAWLVNVDKLPQVKNDAVKFSIIGFAVWVVLGVLMCVGFLGMVAAAVGSVGYHSYSSVW